MRKIFGDSTEEVIGRLQVRLIPFRHMFMGVRDQDGNLAVGTYHLMHGDLRTLYLDVVHELFHVGQFMQDKGWFRKEHRKYLKNFDIDLYYRSPIEIPAYKHTVVEAKRIGMSYEEIAEYLKISPAIDPKVFAEFLNAMELRPDMTPHPSAKILVHINRKVSAPLFNFSDYFVGFDKLPAVKTLLGRKTADILDELKVAFAQLPFGFISLNEEDGNLEVGTQYLQAGDERLIYMDIIACLNLLTHPSKRRGADTNPHHYAENSSIAEAYRVAVAEARRVSLSDSEISDHLNFLRFRMPPPIFQEFIKTLGLRTNR